MTWWLALFLTSLGHAQVAQRENVFYAEGATKRPAVLLFPDWLGPGEFSRERARDLATAGYVAAVVDVYGAEERPRDANEARRKAGDLSFNRPLLRKRILAALAELKKDSRVDPKRIAALGYGFGGLGALELARATAELRGVVVFHGELDARAAEETVRAPVLLLLGGEDRFVPRNILADFMAEMRKSGAPLEIATYGQAQHGFSDPATDQLKIAGAAYNALAATRAWTATQNFLREVFAR